MKYFSKIIIVCTFIFSLSSCLDSDNSVDKPDGGGNLDPNRLIGVLISNEGNFGSANASIDFLEADGELTKNLYKNANEQQLLGDVLQGTYIDDAYSYLVINNSNKVEVLDRNTFKIVATITNELNLPRYVTATEDYIFVTNNHSTFAGDSGGFITIYNKENFEYISTIELPQQVEKIFHYKNYIYVQQSYFSDGNKITKIDAKTFKVIDDIELEKGLRDMSWGVGKYFYAVSNSDTDCNEFTECAEELNVVIYQIDKKKGTIQKTWTINEYVTNLDHYKDDVIFYTTSNKVYSLNTAKEEDLPISIYSMEETDWSNFYGFSVLEDKIYFSDVNGFVAASDVYILNTKGDLLKTFKGGRGVNDFYLYK